MLLPRGQMRKGDCGGRLMSRHKYTLKRLDLEDNLTAELSLPKRIPVLNHVPSRSLQQPSFTSERRKPR
jgi:hypothetical protein